MKDSVPKLEEQSLLNLPDELIEDNIICYLSLKDLHNCSKCENEILKEVQIGYDRKVHVSNFLNR